MSAPTITPRTKTIVLLQGDDEAELQRLREEANRLRKRAGRSDEAARQADEAEWAADRFAEEAEERGVKVVLRSLSGRKKWRNIVSAHPPRKGDQQDQDFGANVDTFPDELVPACLVEPSLSEEELEEFLDSLSHADWDRLVVAAWEVNAAVGADPKARLSSGRTPS